MPEWIMKNQNSWISMQKWNLKSLKTTENGWQQTKSPHKEGTQTPLPASPEHRNKLQGAPDTTHITMATTKEGPTSNQEGNEMKIETKAEHHRVEVKDSTLMITGRCSPTKYQELLADKTQPLHCCCL